MNSKDKYIYREYYIETDKGYCENVYATSVFDTIEELIACIEDRKKFYCSFWRVRKVEIEIIKENSDGRKIKHKRTHKS